MSTRTHVRIFGLVDFFARRVPHAFAFTIPFVSRGTTKTGKAPRRGGGQEGESGDEGQELTARSATCANLSLLVPSVVGLHLLMQKPRSISQDATAADAHSSASTTLLVSSSSASSSSASSSAPAPLDSPFEAAPLLDRETLAQWFPHANDGQDQDDGGGGSGGFGAWRSKRSHALLLQIALVAVVLGTNVGLTAYGALHFASAKGVGVLYLGDCGTVKRLDQWLHLLVNLLSTGLLGASNFCMQLQAAPTRADIDRAHRADRSVDVGVPSLRNLQYISNWRRLAWALLALSSLPIHLIYNSAVFQALSSNDYTVAVVTNAFADGAPWNLSTAQDNVVYGGRTDPGFFEVGNVNPDYWDYEAIIAGMQQGVMNGSYVSMNISACLATYDDYFAPQGNVVVFVQNASVQASANGSLLLYVGVVPRTDDWAKDMWAIGNGTVGWTGDTPSLPVASWFVGYERYQVSHCAVQPGVASTDRCRFEYSPPIMIAVCVLNSVKLLVMLAVWTTRRVQEAPGAVKKRGKYRARADEEVISTLGDAISSFMRTPDPTTENMCLANKDHFVWTRPWSYRLKRKPPTPPQGPLEWKPKVRFWMSSAGLSRWLLLVAMWVILNIPHYFLRLAVLAAVMLTTRSSCIGFTIAFVILADLEYALGQRKITTSVPSLWSMGFGALSQYTYLVVGLPTEDPVGLIANVLVANVPQVLLSLVYVFYNTLLSTYLVQHEFSQMHREAKRKPLRVSEPVGLQRSTYTISLPLRYGIPLYAISGVMHWLFSQSFFLARVTALNTDGSVDERNSFSTCGYSPIAFIITLIAGAVLVLFLVLLGLRRYDGTMSMVATNSRAISAACHVLEGDRDEGYQLPIRWGVVSVDDEGVGHCAFTTAPARALRPPVENARYM